MDIKILGTGCPKCNALAAAAQAAVERDGIKATIEKVEDIAELIPPETVRWSGPGFRYDDQGWIFVHIEGEPYQRGYQYGYLVADEIVEYINKLGIDRNRTDPTRWLPENSR